MKVKLVRNATLLVEFGGAKFLIDPYLAKKESNPGFEGTVNSHLRNPRVEIRTSPEQVLDVDAVIVTHTHPDHWDETAIKLVPKHLPLFAQHEKDAELIRSQGFQDVRVLSEGISFKGVTLIKTPGQHGSDQALAAIPEIIGKVCGVVFKHSSEKILYLAGDTIWNESVKLTLDTHSPDVVVLNAGDAQVPGLGSIIMDAEDVREVYHAAPQAILVACHMEAVNHCVLTRAALREFSKQNRMSDRLLVPNEDEAYTF